MITPHTASTSIPRERLMELLDTGKTKRLTVLRAPAGFGKTTILSQWTMGYKGRTAWVSIDPSDNDPIRFWQYVSRAIGTAIKTDLYEQLYPLFNIQPRISIDLFVDLIINEISNYSLEIQLVLDDYQSITHSVIHRSIARLVDNLPNNFRLLISSRSELPLPLLRWREKSYIQEIMGKEIKFTYKETSLYLKGRFLPTYGLEILHEIYKKTEGWATGIELAANAFEKGIATNAKRDEFSGKDTYVSEYLFYQLLETLSAEETEFLLKVSVLNYLEPNICNELTGNKKSESILSSFEKRGLFIKKLDNKKYIFRYHHLFGDFFMQELYLRSSSSELEELFSTAAHILYERADFIHAIELALRGGLYELAVNWIEKHLVDLLTLGQTDTFVRWTDLLVRKGHVLSLSMRIMYTFALAMLSDFGRALQVIKELENQDMLDQWMTHKDKKTEVADFIGIKAYVVLFGQNDVHSSMQLMLERFEQQPKNSKLDVIPIRYNVFNPILLRTKMGLKGKLWPQKTIRDYFNTFRKTDYKKLNVTGYSYGVAAETFVEWNRIEEALPVIEEAVRIGHHFQDTGLVVPMYILKSQIEMSQQNYLEVQALLTYAESYCLNLKENQWLESIYAMRAIVYLRQSKVEEAEQELYKVESRKDYIGGRENEFWWFVHVRILIKKKEYERALKNIEKMKVAAQEEEKVSMEIEALLLKALLYTVIDDDRRAFGVLHEALEIGYPYSYIRVYVNETELYPLINKYMKLRKTHEIISWNTIPLSYLEKIVEVFNHEPSILGASSVEKRNPLDDLTRREIEVLRLLTTGVTNREIATELYLSPGTIRIYLSNIYAKLQVGSRTKAVIIAKENNIN